MLVGWPIQSPGREVAVRPGLYAQFSGLDRSRDFLIFVKPCGQFDTRCSRFLFFHRGAGKAFLVRGFGIARDLPQASVAGDGRDLVLGTTGLRQSTGGGLPETMRRAMVKVCHVALSSEPV